MIDTDKLYEPMSIPEIHAHMMWQVLAWPGDLQQAPGTVAVLASAERLMWYRLSSEQQDESREYLRQLTVGVRP